MREIAGYLAVKSMAPLRGMRSVRRFPERLFGKPVQYRRVIAIHFKLFFSPVTQAEHRTERGSGTRSGVISFVYFLIHTRKVLRRTGGGPRYKLSRLQAAQTFSPPQASPGGWGTSCFRFCCAQTEREEILRPEILPARQHYVRNEHWEKKRGERSPPRALHRAVCAYICTGFTVMGWPTSSVGAPAA